MGSVVIVVMEPGRVGGFAFDLGSVGPCIGPFGGEGAVEAFDLAVSLWSERAGAAVRDPWPERGGERVRSVAGTVIGHHCGDDDAVLGEERVCALPEPGSGVLAFVGQAFGIGQSGAVIDCVV